MPKWKELLADRNKYPDDFAFSVGDQTLTLAQMRAEDAETEGALTAKLTAREKELAKRESDLNNASISLGTVVEKTAAAAGITVDELLSGKAPTKKAVAQSADLDEDDPLTGKLVKDIKALRAELAATKGDIDTVRKNALGPMLNTYLEDYYETKWEKIEPTLPKGADVSREKALKYAQENGYKDAKGRLDLSKAVKDLTYEARIEVEAQKRADSLRKKDDDARLLASVPKPGNLGAKVRTDKSLTNAKGQTKSFDEMLADAQGDTDMWRQIQGGQA